MGWNYSIPNFNGVAVGVWESDKLFHCAFSRAYDYRSMLRFKRTHVNKMVPGGLYVNDKHNIKVGGLSPDPFYKIFVIVRRCYFARKFLYGLIHNKVVRILPSYCLSMLESRSVYSLQTESCHDANFVVTGGTENCRDVNSDGKADIMSPFSMSLCMKHFSRYWLLVPL